MSRRVIGAALLGAALTLDITACYALASALGTRNDLFPRWLAVRLWLERGWDLYSPETESAIREAMGPLPMEASASVFGFVYPAYVALLLLPLGLLPFRLAATLWLLVLQFSAVAGAQLTWRAYERERRLRRAPSFPALALGALLPATVLNLLFLQLAGPVLLALAAGWWLLVVHRREVVSGGAVALSAIKPQLALLTLVLLLARAVAHRQWRLFLSVLGGAGSLAAVSALLFPDWLERFLNSASLYAAEANPQSAASLLARTSGGGVEMHAAVAGVVLALIALAWWRTERGVGDTLAAGVLASLWLVPPLYEWNSMLLVLLLVQVLRNLHELDARAGWGGVAALLSLGGGTFWAYTVIPSEARLIWPSAGLIVYLLGSQRVTSSGPAPSVPARR